MCRLTKNDVRTMSNLIRGLCHERLRRDGPRAPHGVRRHASPSGAQGQGVGLGAREPASRFIGADRIGGLPGPVYVRFWTDASAAVLRSSLTGTELPGSPRATASTLPSSGRPRTPWRAVRRIADGPEGRGKDCDLLVRDKEGGWREIVWPPDAGLVRRGGGRAALGVSLRTAFSPVLRRFCHPATFA